MRCPARLAVATLVFVLSGATASACKKQPADVATHNEPSRTPVDAYTVQGIIRALPSDPGAGKPMTILHQAIPTFKDRAGEQVGMMSMPMPFTIANNVDVAGYQVGDKVEFTFEVRWQEGIPTHITALRKLPPEHEIKFSGE